MQQKLWKLRRTVLTPGAQMSKEQVSTLKWLIEAKRSYTLSDSATTTFSPAAEHKDDKDKPDKDKPAKHKVDDKPSTVKTSGKKRKWR